MFDHLVHARRTFRLLSVRHWVSWLVLGLNSVATSGSRHALKTVVNRGQVGFCAMLAC
jgi:hypothetical protein